MIFAAIVLFIASREIPAVRDAVQRLTAPERWQAGDACRRAALRLAHNPDFARVVEPGVVHATQNGFFVDQIVVGEMASTGGEARFTVTCYADPGGQVVRADRTDR